MDKTIVTLIRERFPEAVSAAATGRWLFDLPDPRPHDRRPVTLLEESPGGSLSGTRSSPA